MENHHGSWVNPLFMLPFSSSQTVSWMALCLKVVDKSWETLWVMPGPWVDSPKCSQYISVWFSFLSWRLGNMTSALLLCFFSFSFFSLGSPRFRHSDFGGLVSFVFELGPSVTAGRPPSSVSAGSFWPGRGGSADSSGSSQHPEDLLLARARSGNERWTGTPWVGCASLWHWKVHFRYASSGQRSMWKKSGGDAAFRRCRAQLLALQLASRFRQHAPLVYALFRGAAAAVIAILAATFSSVIFAIIIVSAIFTRGWHEQTKRTKKTGPVTWTGGNRWGFQPPFLVVIYNYARSARSARPSWNSEKRWTPIAPRRNKQAVDIFSMNMYIIYIYIERERDKYPYVWQIYTIYDIYIYICDILKINILKQTQVFVSFHLTTENRYGLAEHSVFIGNATVVN